MFAPTTHLREDEQWSRERRKLDVILVMLTGLCAIAAGLAMSAVSARDLSVIFLPV